MALAARESRDREGPGNQNLIRSHDACQDWYIEKGTPVSRRPGNSVPPTAQSIPTFWFPSHSRNSEGKLPSPCSTGGRLKKERSLVSLLSSPTLFRAFCASLL